MKLKSIPPHHPYATPLSVSSPSPLFAQTGREIVEKSEDAVRANSITGTYEITVKTRRWTRTMSMKYQEVRGARKSSRRFFRLARTRGTASS